MLNTKGEWQRCRYVDRKKVPSVFIAHSYGRFISLEQIDFSLKTVAWFTYVCSSYVPKYPAQLKFPQVGTECVWRQIFFSPTATTFQCRLSGLPLPVCGRSVTDCWSWGARREQLSCPDDVSDDMFERRVPGEALNLNSTGYPDHGRYRDLPLQGNIPTAELGIEPGTSSQKFWSPNHEAGLNVKYMRVYRGIQLKCKLRHSGTWSDAARPLHCLCCRPAVF
jgi:hypothetical protein